MKIPYLLAFANADKTDHYGLDDLPNWSRYPMSFAHTTSHYKENDSEFLIQRSGVYPFYIDLVEVMANDTFEIPFIVEEKQLFLYFMLEGSLGYSTADQKPIARTPERQFLISSYNKGSYTAEASKGKHTALVVTLSSQWMENLSEGLPHLQRILDEYNSVFNQTKAMQQCRIDQKVQRWLYEIYSDSNKNKVILESKLWLYLSYILEYYNQMLGEQQADPIYQVLHYLNDHYYKPGITNELLADMFPITLRTLSKRFKEEFSISPHRYCNMLRMQKAQCLIETYGEPVQRVYKEVGFENENAFRIAYKKHKVQS